MQLALFTPGAYLWPVYRNFEAFLAAIATPACDAADLASSRLFPARYRSDSSIQGHSPALDKRLVELHRELYTALLRPREHFEREERCFADCFWPDLRHSGFDALFEALSFYFTRRRSYQLSVVQGLNLLRSVFFNHEAAEPELWLQMTRARLRPLRLDCIEFQADYLAPPAARVEALAFCINSSRQRAVLGPGWICGSIQRRFDGQLVVSYSCGHSPDASQADGLRDKAALRQEAEAELQRVFGWRGERAA